MNDEVLKTPLTPEQLAAELEVLKKGPGEYETANEAISIAFTTEELLRKSVNCESSEIQIALRQAATNNMAEYLLQSTNGGLLDLATEKLTAARSIISKAPDLLSLKKIVNNQ